MAVVVRDFVGKDDWSWFIARNPIKRVEDTCGRVVEDDETGEILAILIGDTWYGDSVSLHIVVMDKRAYEHISEGFEFVFNNPKYPDVKIAYGFIPTNNEKGYKLIKRLGFKDAYTLSGGTDGTGFNITTMTREEYTKLKGVYHGST
ncbi:MAG: hypothetical protein IZT57_01205 [Chloroflexi bacterium]|nr:hypothetical protein [Chloroflexota bacterium]